MKKGIIKSMIISGMALLMVIPFAGCKKASVTEDPKNAKEYVFKYQGIELNFPGDNDMTYFDVSSIDTTGNRAFAVASSYDYDTGENLSYLINIDPDSLSSNISLMEKPDLSECRPEEYVGEDGFWENSYYGNMTALDGEIVGTCQYSCSYYSDVDYFSADSYFICAWDTNGKYKWKLNLSDELKAEYIYVNSLFVGGDKLYALVNGSLIGGKNFSGLVTVENNGNIGKTFELNPSTTINAILPTKDGRFIATYYDESYNIKAAYLDQSTGEIGEAVVVPDNFLSNGYSSVRQGFDTDFIYSNSQGVFKFNIGDTESTKLMDPINSDLNGYNVSKFAFIDKDHFIGSYSNLETYNSEIALFSYVDPATIPDKKVISMAVYYLSSDVRKRVVDFNKESDAYRIVVTDYSQYATPEDYAAGYTKLNNDILAGQVPSIIFISPNSNINYDSFARKGLLAEIDDLIKKDEELKDLKYLDNVFDAYAIRGKHYMVVPTFYYTTYMANSDIVGNRSSISISEYLDLVKSLGADVSPVEYCTQEAFLNLFLNNDGSEFIDPATQKCDLANDEFVSMIEYISKLPKEYNYDDEEIYTDYYDNFRSGKILLSNLYLSDANQYQYQKYNMFNGKGVCIGFPTRQDQPGVINASGTTFVITKGKNIDGAWDFARYYLTPEYQSTIDYSIPVLESEFDRWAAKAMEKPYWEDENGIKNYYDNYYYVDGIENIIPVMTQEEVDAMKSMIKSCKKSTYQNDQIMSIIEEECSGCFAGQKSAKDVCNVIQSRVQLYINENN